MFYRSHCNIYERDNWIVAPDERVATRIIIIDNVSVAVQPLLDIENRGVVPDWAGWYDCQQGGLNHNGQFKIYDFPPNWMGNAALITW